MATDLTAAPPIDPAATPAATPAPAITVNPAVEPVGITAEAGYADAAKADAPAPPASAAAATGLKADTRSEAVPLVRPALMAAAASRGRFPLLAASVAIAAAFGSVVGAGAYTAASHFLLAPPPAAKAEPLDETKELQARVTQLRASVKALADSVAALRTTAEASGKGNAAQLAKMGEQLAKLAESVDRSERAQTEPAARLSKAVEALERLDKRAQAQSAPETTGSVPAARSEPPKPTIVQGWLLRQVVDGVALLEGQDRVIEVEAGDTIRGVGRVEDIRRQDGRWVVVTSKGLIVARR
jgi:hypothetical protein